MAITITAGAGGTWVTELELDLYAGTPVDSTTWQGTSYPGSITGSFDAVNTDRAQVAGTKLMCGTFTIPDYTAAGLTLQISGEGTKIVSFVLGDSGVTDDATSGVGSGAAGALSDTAGNGNNDTLTLTYTGAGGAVKTAACQIWLIVA